MTSVILPPKGDVFWTMCKLILNDNLSSVSIHVNTVVFFAKTNCTLGVAVCYYAEHVNDEKDSYDKKELLRITFNIKFLIILITVLL